jgi:hypothetical protein
VHAACWAHARRKFFQAVELNPQDQSAVRIVAQIDELFAIDSQARKQAISRQDRQLLRLEKSKSLLEQIKTQIQTARCSSKGAVGDRRVDAEKLLARSGAGTGITSRCGDRSSVTPRK